MKRFFNNWDSLINQRGTVIGIVCALFCIALNHTNALQRLENVALDACFQLRGRRTSESKVYLLVIDDTAIQKLKKPLVQISPELATVIAYLKTNGASAVGVDLIISRSAESMSELKPGQVGDADSMAVAVSQAGNVVLAESIGSDGVIEGPLKQWQTFTPRWNDAGYVNLTVDSDMCLRRQLLRAPVGDQVHPSLSAAVYSKASGLGSDWLEQPKLSIGEDAIPLDRGNLLVNYVGPTGTFPRLRFSEVLEAANSNTPLSEDVEGSMILIGGEFQTQQDSHATPFSGQSNLLTFLPTSWLGYSPSLMSGVEVHANILATLNDKAFLFTPWLMKTPLLLLVFGVLLASALTQVNLESGAIITVLHHFAWKFVSVLAFCLVNWQVEVIAMLLLGPIVYGAVFALRWRLIRRMMGLFKSEAIARAMELNPGQLNLHGEARVLTVLFSDIRGFTTFSEGNSPQAVVRLLNEYFTAIVPVIEEHGGVVNQYMGDGIMVLFGAPVDQPDHAHRAVTAGLDILQEVDNLHDHWRSLGIDSLRVGVGIHTGNAIVGTVGSPRRLDYTAIGDTVNTASRIESATKEVGASLLISEQTLDAISEGQRKALERDFVHHSISVKGKQKQLSVYSLPELESSKNSPHN